MTTDLGHAPTPTAPEIVAHGVLALLAKAVPRAAAAITVSDNRTGCHRLLANDGYDGPVAGYLGDGFVRADPYYAMVLSHADDPLFWADVPGFERSVMAREVLRPQGFREGTSVPLGDGRLSGMLHVSFCSAELDPKTGSVIAGFLKRCSDAVTDQLALQEWRLSPRELEVLRLIALGRSNPEIADMLYLARRTVATHVEHIFAKTGLSSRVSVAVRAAQLGLVR
jgi:DNA-binding CsgD family transcriptional regulator